MHNIAMMVASNKKKRDTKALILQSEAFNVVSNSKVNINVKKLLCASLFWREGAKNVSSDLRFINSDPIMIQTFLKLFRESFAIDESKLKALLHIHEYHNSEKQLLYWSEITKIPVKQFYNPYLKPHTGKIKREGYPGCISIR